MSANGVDDVTMIWSTFPDAASAKAAARRLVDARVAACVVVLPGLASVYRWRGEVEEAEEVGVLLKTAASRVEAARAALAALHPYEVPAILVWSAAAAPAYAAWVGAETAAH